jgi:hypothetical protein
MEDQAAEDQPVAQAEDNPEQSQRNEEGEGNAEPGRPNPTPGGEERKQILQDIFERYMKAEEKVVAKEMLPALLADYDQVLGQQSENAIELLQSLRTRIAVTYSLDSEEDGYTFEQLCEVLCPEPTPQAPVAQEEPETLERIEELSPPLKVQMSRPTFEQLQALTPAEVEKLSIPILKQKFQKHRSHIQ